MDPDPWPGILDPEFLAMDPDPEFLALDPDPEFLAMDLYPEFQVIDPEFLAMDPEPGPFSTISIRFQEGKYYWFRVNKNMLF